MHLEKALIKLMEENNEDHEISMSKSDLVNIEKNLEELMKIMGSLNDSTNLEGWVQSKITKANEYLEAITNHLRTKY